MRFSGADDLVPPAGNAGILIFQRLDDLEQISKRFPGVEKAFAIQAGREVRVVLWEMAVGGDDEGARSIIPRYRSLGSNRSLTYPGQIKITVIRETRAIDIAK